MKRCKKENLKKGVTIEEVAVEDTEVEEVVMEVEEVEAEEEGVVVDGRQFAVY